jgi:hypothetical protein
MTPFFGLNQVENLIAAHTGTTVFSRVPVRDCRFQLW